MIKNIIDANQTGLADSSEIRRQVTEVIASTPIFDMHTHLFAP